MDSSNDHDPLTTIALLATAEVQEFLEGIRLSFQPDDAEFAETIHDELTTPPTPIPPTYVGVCPARVHENDPCRYHLRPTRSTRPALHATGERPP